MNNSEIIQKANSKQEQILKKFILNYGINISITKAYIENTVNDIDVLDDEFEISTLNRKQNENTRIAYETTSINTKAQFTEVETENKILLNNDFFNNIDTVGLDYKINCYIVLDEILEVGTIIKIIDTSIKFKVSKIYKNYPTSKIYKYLLVRE